MELTWQPQKFNECWITALAIATQQSVDELRSHWEDISNCPYAETPRYQWFKAATTLLQPYKPRARISHKAYASIGFAAIPTELESSPKRFYPSLLRGIGLFTYQRTHAVAHTIAFNNGIVCDSGAIRLPRPVPYAQWLAYKRARTNLKQFITWRIDYLIQI